MTRIAKWALDLARFDVRSTLPAAIQAIMQNGMLERTFEDALVPDFLYPAVASSRPWQANLGDTATFTRTGLLTPQTTPLGGADPSAGTYGIEQYSVTMDQYGFAVDTNMLQSAMTLASKFLEDIQKLGINAGQSINQVSRNKLYKAYAGGRTWCTTAGSSDTSIIVASVNGFDKVLVNGVLTPVSVTNPLNVTINGVANTVVGANAGTSTLTLGTARADVVGDPVIAANAPVSIRFAGRNTPYDYTGSDVASMAMFRSAVVRLRSMNVPTLNGNYIAHIPPATEGELFADADFKQAYQGRGDSQVFGSMSMGTFAGIDWVRNNESPTVLGGSAGNVTVYEPIVLGGDALIAAPFADMASLLAGTGVEDVPNIRMVGPANGLEVALVVRPPQDRLQQVIGSAWSYVGDFAVPSDSTTGDAALYKRGVVVFHA
jgi:hypothetical protein